MTENRSGSLSRWVQETPQTAPSGCEVRLHPTADREDKRAPRSCYISLIVAEKNQGPPIEEALDLLTHTLDALRAEHGEDSPVHGSRVKQAIKRQHLGFNERAYGFRTFSDLLLKAKKRGLLKLESDKNAGDYFLHPAE